MGLSIHYRGKFNTTASLTKMIDEIKDIAKTLQWSFTFFETEFPEKSFETENYNDKVYGICFSPPECEPVFFSFLSNGKMSSFINLEFYGNSNDKTYQDYLEAV